MAMSPLTGERSLTRAEAERLSRNWWVPLALGIISILAGLFILGFPWTLQSLAFFIGALLVVRGLFQAFSPSLSGGSRGWSVALGILSILVGLAVFAWPARTLLLVALFVGAWLVVSGIYDIVTSIASRRTAPHWGLVLLRGIIAVPLGIIALNRPLLTLEVLVAVVGIWAIVAGVLEIVVAFEVKDLPRKLEAARGPVSVEEAERIAAMRDRGEMSEQEYEQRTGTHR